MEPEPSPPVELKIEFSDVNNHKQYDSSASRVVFYSSRVAEECVPEGVKRGELWLGDKDSISMVQLQHRGITDVIVAEEDLFGKYRKYTNPPLDIPAGASLRLYQLPNTF